MNNNTLQSNMPTNGAVPKFYVNNMVSTWMDSKGLSHSISETEEHTIIRSGKITNISFNENRNKFQYVIQCQGGFFLTEEDKLSKHVFSIKYNLFKDNTPILETFKSDDDVELRLEELHSQGYKSAIKIVSDDINFKKHLGIKKGE